jgi:hypothetical protein
VRCLAVHCVISILMNRRPLFACALPHHRHRVISIRLVSETQVSLGPLIRESIEVNKARVALMKKPLQRLNVMQNLLT